VNELAAGIGRAQLKTTVRVLDELCRRLEADGGAESAARKGGTK